MFKNYIWCQTPSVLVKDLYIRNQIKNDKIVKYLMMY